MMKSPKENHHFRSSCLSYVNIKNVFVPIDHDNKGHGLPLESFYIACRSIIQSLWVVQLPYAFCFIITAAQRQKGQPQNCWVLLESMSYAKISSKITYLNTRTRIHKTIRAKSCESNIAAFPHLKPLKGFSGPHFYEICLVYQWQLEPWKQNTEVSTNHEKSTQFIA